MTIEPGQSERCHVVCARVRFREIRFQRAKKTVSAGLRFDFQVLSLALAVRCIGSRGEKTAGLLVSVLVDR